MKKVLKKMEELQIELEQEVESRQSFSDNRSMKWQDSEKGQEYQEKTDRLQEMLDEVQDWQMELGDE